MASASTLVILAFCVLPTTAASLSNQTQTRVAAVFVDDTHISALDSPRVRQIIRTVLNQLLKDDGLVELTSSGRVRRLAFVYDRDLARIEWELRTVMGSASTPRANPDPSWVAQQQRVAGSAISAAANLISDLERNPHRPKALVYLSGGYTNAGASVEPLLDDLGRIANRAGIVIYHLDPARWDAGDPKSSASLDRLAAATGGFTLTAVTDFTRIAKGR